MAGSRPILKGPYVQRDGMTNPENFVAHRKALMRLSVHVPALAAAWVLTGERRYAAHAARHSRAWFTDAATMMNPHLRYAQAIKGRVDRQRCRHHRHDPPRRSRPRRLVLRSGGVLERSTAAGLRDWFDKYLTWMTTHEYGIAEREARNNHATCWVMQVAEFARYTGRHRSRATIAATGTERVLVPNQVGPDGSFPEELRRTKPYGYSLFNLDAMATVCQILSTPGEAALDVRDCRRTRHPQGADVHVSVHRRQESAGRTGRRHVLRRVADASSRTPVRGAGISSAQVGIECGAACGRIRTSRK